MAMFHKNWLVQIRKGYLELMILQLINSYGELYGLEVLQKLEKMGFQTKEGTLYPLLSRLTKEKFLKARWVSQEKGVPKKYYSLTQLGLNELQRMSEEFESMNNHFQSIQQEKK